MSTIRMWLRAIIAPLLATSLLVLTGQAPAAADTTSDDTTTVVVQETEDAGGRPAATVRSVGGKVVYDLPIINGFVAEVPTWSLGKIESAPGVRHATEDAPVEMHGLLDDTLSGLTETVNDVTAPVADVVEDLTTVKSVDQVVEEPATADELPPVETPADDTHPAGTLVADPDTPTVYQDEIAAGTAHEAGATGAGTTVALIDTGVADVPDLAGRIQPVVAPNGDVKQCVDLSGENTCNDSYGHGTFLAGLIAGNGAASNGKYTGVAPDTKILSIKIGGRDGSASVGKILFAIQWVASHKAQYNIGVLNLSLGTDSTQSYRYDPLNYAVERAWASGIAVVVSAGNRGPGAKTISKPADDPFVITTGAIDDAMTPSTDDDLLPDFSSKGPTASDGITKPDITAPGARLVSLRSPGSAIEEQFPGGGVDSVYRRGSGTSQSAAVVSGSVALLLSKYPNLTPDRVKYILKHTTSSTVSTDRNVVGAGLLNIGAAVTAPPAGKANQNLTKSNGWGSLRNSQGSIGLIAKDGSRILGNLGGIVPIKGEDSGNPTGGGWYGTGWAGGGWYGGGWYGGGWYGGGWYGGGWYGGGWYGGGWYGGGWYGGAWYGAWD